MSPDRWSRTRREAYGLALTTLALSLPFHFVFLVRHLGEIEVSGLTVVYAGFTLIGYYGTLLLVIVSVAFWACSVFPRLALFAAGCAIAASLFYLVVNGVVYNVYRFHIDPFWMNYAVTQYSGLGVPRPVAAQALLVLIGILVLQLGMFELAKCVGDRRRVGIGLTTLVLGALGASQSLHIAAYHQNDARITHVTPTLPFYFPITSSRHALRYGHLIPFIATPADADTLALGSTFHYPLASTGCVAEKPGWKPNIVMLLLESWRYDAMDGVVSPRIDAFSRESSVFARHFSSGNATPHGVFGLFYGIHPTYWEAVKANSAAIDNPVLIDALEANGYAFGLFADSHFDRLKITQTIFAGIPIVESFPGRDAAERDATMTEELIAFLADQQRSGSPFFGFAFYKSTHHSYAYPDAGRRFRPARDLNAAFLDADLDPTPHLNDYRNAVYHVDGLIGRIIEHLETTELLDETIVIITSDHGEQFNDNRRNYWGHTSNFTRFQTQVPMIIRFPGRTPSIIEASTSHTDLPVTLLQEAFGCGLEASIYSNGRNLLRLDGTPRPIVVGGYASHAFILGDDVYAVHPLRARSYRLSNVTADADAPDPTLLRQAAEETSRFFMPASTPGRTAPAAAPSRGAARGPDRTRPPPVR